MAVLFHTFHDAVSQVLVPKSLGDGQPLLLGEAGVFPVLCYLAAGLTVFSVLRRRGQSWRMFAQSAIHDAPIHDVARARL